MCLPSGDFGCLSCVAVAQRFVFVLMLLHAGVNGVFFSVAILASYCPSCPTPAHSFTIVSLSRTNSAVPNAFEPSAGHAELRRMVREFAEKEVDPQASCVCVCVCVCVCMCVCKDHPVTDYYVNTMRALSRSC